MKQRLRVFTADGTEISDDIKLRDGRASIGGWSQYKIFHVYEINGLPVEDFVGWLESGCPCDFKEGYRYELEELPDDE